MTVDEGAEAPVSRARLRALRAVRHSLKVPPVPRDFRADIEGMRAIAVLGVLLWHAGVTVVPGGFVGVDVFFVVSGFLMTALLLEEARERGRIDLGRFYARRARRLLPAALAALVGTAVLTLLFLPRTRWWDTGIDLLTAASYVVNWRMSSGATDYLDVSRAPSPVQHYWSLAVEEQFYVVWPVLLLGLLVLARGRARVFRVTSWTLTLALLAASLAVSHWWTQTYAAQAYFVTPTRVHELMIGAVVALGARGWPTIPRLLSAVLGWLGLVMIMASLFAIDQHTPFPGTAALWPTVGTALVLISGARAGLWGPEFILRARWMQWVGRISYSLYLWHWPFVAAAASILAVGSGGPVSLPVQWGLVAVLVSVLPAWLSFRYVEEPVRVRGRVLQARVGPGVATYRALRLGASCSLAGALLGLTLMSVAPPRVDGEAVAWRTPALVDDLRQPVGAGTLADAPAPGGGSGTEEQLAAAPERMPDTLGELAVPVEQVPADRPVLTPEGCFPGLTESKVGVCEAGDPDGPVTIALFGDSHAAMWVTALDEIGRERGWRVVTVAKSSCPPVDELSFSRGQAPQGYEQCTAYQEKVLDRLVELDPDVVVMSSASYGASDEAVAEALARRVDQLRAAGIEPVLLRDVPRPPFDVPECLVANEDRATRCVFDRSEGLTRSGTGHALLAELRPDLPVVDLTKAICPAEECDPVVGGVVVWRDSNHVSATYVRSLRGLVEQQLLPVVALTQLRTGP
ncbi:acyltransferase family protein [Ornithinimicrobium tianjinense]|uniref:Acyltransferase n=1 Tax=Ornithinimicrobium tianjinense TaxID=1195761 RepID=A0A917BSL9_9MICO|nr:acyltransferase family protein [Ornithinimicrobium tianjinense]GGF52947.1 acyltransferase [Ornithinimicrobium tianjinense]